MPSTITISRKYIVKDTGGILRKDHSNTSARVAAIKGSTIIVATKVYGYWYYTTYNGKKGWIHKNYLTLKSSEDNGGGTASVTKVQNTETTNNNTDGGFTAEELAQQEALIEEYTNIFNSYNSSYVNGCLASNMNGIFGMPYQFTSMVDPKVQGTEFGYKYMEKIVTKMPLLLISPGKVEFMPDSTKKEQAGVISNLAETMFGANSNLNDIINNSGRYYGFKTAFKEYFDFVTTMCRSCSKFLGIDDVKVSIGGESNTLARFDWSKVNGNDFGNYFSASECVCLYVDSVNSVSDSFSNSTTESQLASKINSYSEVGREISFLLGTQAGTQFSLMDQDEIQNTIKTIDDISDSYLKGNQLFKDLGSKFATIAAGGKLIFPEIWEDSTFTRSFDINLKLRTPDCDILSWYLNICVPMCFLIGLVAPQQHTNMGYFSPFLVQASYKGLFNVDMGIITELSFTKGREGAWTINGLPTEVDVSITLKDLYQAVLTISTQDPDNWFVNNTTLMNYMANLCGININKPDIARTIEIWTMLKSNKILDIPTKIHQTVMEEASNMAMKAYKGFQNILF